MYPHDLEQSNGTRQTQPRKKNKKWMVVLIVSLVVLLVGGGCIAGFLIHQKQEEERAFQQMVDDTLAQETFYHGVVVQGVELGGKTKEEAKSLLMDQIEELKEPVDIKVLYKGQEFQLTQKDFSYTDNLDEVLEESYALYRSGDRMERYEQIQALKENPKRFELEVQLQTDNERIEAFVQQISEQCGSAAQDAKVVKFEPLSGNKFTYEEGKSGTAVDTEALTQRLKEVLDSENKVASFDVPVKETQPAVTVDDLKARTVKLSSYTTTSTNTADGNSNMRLALAAANGTILQPDDVFSFNRTTGDTTTPERGYKKAGALVNGATEQQYGGGICQVSTTIYGAAMRADMDITMRYNHAKPSTYVPIGQDATVDYPSTDFQFRNSSKYPVYIAAWMDGAVLHVEFYGYQPEEWDTIEVSTWKTGTLDQPEDVYTVDKTLAPGEKKLKRAGCAGSKAEGERIYYKDGKKVKVDPIHRSTYRALATEYLVGPES